MCMTFDFPCFFTFIMSIVKVLIEQRRGNAVKMHLSINALGSVAALTCDICRALTSFSVYLGGYSVTLACLPPDAK